MPKTLQPVLVMSWSSVVCARRESCAACTQLIMELELASSKLRFCPDIDPWRLASSPSVSDSFSLSRLFICLAVALWDRLILGKAALATLPINH